MLLQVLVAHVLQVQLLLAVGPRLLQAVQLLVVTQCRGLLTGLGARQVGEGLVGAWLVLVGLAERVRRKPLIQREFAGVQRDALRREAGR